jgi:hypothetical protein
VKLRKVNIMQARLLGILLASLSAPAFAEFVTGVQLKEYLDDARSGASFRSSTVAMGYVAGVYDMVDRTRVCIQRELSAKEAMLIVHRYLTARKEELHQPAATLVVQALSEQFPCDRAAEQ